MPDSEGDPAEKVVQELLSVHRYLRRYAKRACSELGISGRQLLALQYLQEAGPLSVGQIGHYLYLADSTTSELLGGLEARGLVTRGRSSQDNRVAVITLTPAGEELVTRTPLGGIALLRQQLRTQPHERIAAMAEALHQLADLMEIHES